MKNISKAWCKHSWRLLKNLQTGLLCLNREQMGFYSRYSLGWSRTHGNNRNVVPAAASWQRITFTEFRKSRKTKICQSLLIRQTLVEPRCSLSRRVGEDTLPPQITAPICALAGVWRASPHPCRWHYSDILSLVTVCKKKLRPASLCKEATPVNKSRFWQLPDPCCIIQPYSLGEKVLHGWHLAGSRKSSSAVSTARSVK